MEVSKTELVKKGRPYTVTNINLYNKVYLRKDKKYLFIRLKTEKSQRWQKLRLNRFYGKQLWYGKYFDKESLLVIDFHEKDKPIELTIFHSQWHYRVILLTSLIP